MGHEGEPEGEAGHIFLSWSGQASKRVALALRDLLHAVSPRWRAWVSQDIVAGARWGDQVALELRRSRCGIVCLTNTNTRAPWLMFEAGALAHAVGNHEGSERPSLIPLLLDAALSERDLASPFHQFQSLSIREGGLSLEAETPPRSLQRLVAAVCEATGDDPQAAHDRLVARWPHEGRAFVKRVLDLPATLPHADAPIHVGPFTEILADLRCTLDHVDFDGDVYIYNIEMITLENPVLWDFLFSHPGVRRVLLAVRRHVYLRLERRCAGAVAETLRKGSGKLEIFPVFVPRHWRRQAFGYFRFHDPKRRERDLIYRMSKMEPDSSVVQEGGEPTFHYSNYVRIRPRAAACDDLGNRLRSEFEEAVRGRDSFHYDDVAAMNDPSVGHDVEQVLGAHGLTDEDRAGLARVLTSYPLADDVAEGATVDALVDERRLRAFRPWEGTWEKRGGSRMLWVPPWGLPLWRNLTAAFDTLSHAFLDDIDTWYLKYTAPPRQYTFTGAERDIMRAIVALHRGSAGAQDRPFVVSAASVNAYTAVCAVKRCLEAGLAHVDGLVLYASATDLFNAVDSFRLQREDDRAPHFTSQLFSRMFYRSKQRFAPELVREVKYFNKPTNTAHLLDLSVRGRAACSAEHLRAQLDELVHDHECSVTFVHSERDEMTPIADIHDLARSLGWSGDVRLVEAPIYHDIAHDRFELKALFESESEMKRIIRTVYQPIFGRRGEADSETWKSDSGAWTA